MRKLVQDVLSVALNAGRAIIEVYDDWSGYIELKDDETPLTKADVLSHKIILNGLINLGLSIPIVSEEGIQSDYNYRLNFERYWLVDPLDGTKEFIKRNGEFTVNIALIENGVPILGVVHAPVKQITYFAARNLGAFVQKNEDIESIKVNTFFPCKPIRVVVSRSHVDFLTTNLLTQLGDYEVLNMGSSLKLCLVAEGKADLYPRLGLTMEWDTAAAHAIVKEAGGLVCDIDGNELVYNKLDLHNPHFFVFPLENKRTLLEKISSAVSKSSAI